MKKKLQKSYLTINNLLITQDLWQEGLLSNLVNNLAEGIHKVKCKNEPDNKNINV